MSTQQSSAKAEKVNRSPKPVGSGEAKKCPTSTNGEPGGDYSVSSDVVSEIESKKATAPNQAKLVTLEPVPPGHKEDHEFLLEKEAAIKGCIRKGAVALVEMGTLIRELRDYNKGRLFKSRERFESYCQEQFGFKKAHVYRLIDIAVVHDILKSPMGDKTGVPKSMPLSGRQYRALKRLRDPVAMRNVWNETLALAGERPVTEALIKKVIENRLPLNPAAKEGIPGPAKRKSSGGVVISRDTSREILSATIREGIGRVADGLKYADEGVIETIPYSTVVTLAGALNDLLNRESFEGLSRPEREELLDVLEEIAGRIADVRGS